MREQLLTIGDVATRSGVSRKALRLYEARGIVSKPRRTPAGYRVYEADVLGVLHFVAQARRLGPDVEGDPPHRRPAVSEVGAVRPCARVARAETRRPRQPAAGSEEDPQQLGRFSRNARGRLRA